MTGTNAPVRRVSSALFAGTVRMLSPTALSGCLALLLLLPSVAPADCGDDVGGVRIACRCGDVVVTDATLLPDDPVVVERCGADGLIVRADAGVESLRLNLGGQTLLGSGSGVGVRILDGGSAGAAVIGGSIDQPGAIVGFGTGLRAVSHGALSSVKDLIVRGNEYDGLVVRGTDTVVENVVSDANGRDGMRLSGRGVDARALRSSDNRRFGVRATGRNVVGDVAAPGNGRAAAVVPRATRSGLEVAQ